MAIIEDMYGRNSAHGFGGSGGSGSGSGSALTVSASRFELLLFFLSEDLLLALSWTSSAEAADRKLSAAAVPSRTASAFLETAQPISTRSRWVDLA